jgi:hypothetical protein
MLPVSLQGQDGAMALAAKVLDAVLRKSFDNVR